MSGFRKSGHIKVVGRREAGVGWVVTKANIKSKMTQIVEFRVAMMSTFTHKGSIFHYKGYTDVH